MADIIFQGGYKALVTGLLDGAPDIRLRLVMSGFSGASEEDAINVSDITTIDEFDGIGYLEIDCANVSMAYDSAENEYQLTHDAAEFNASGGTVSPGIYDVVAVLGKDAVLARLHKALAAIR